MNNIDYIKNWFLTNNKFLNEDEYKEQKLDILVFYTIVFEKLGNLNIEDQIIINNGMITCEAKDMINNPDVERILNIINIKFGYLSYEKLEKTPGYTYMKLSGINGLVTPKELKENLEEIYLKTLKYYNNYNFNKYVYKINEKIFFSVNQLNENELLQLYEINDHDQTLYEISHNQNGEMEIY